MSDFGLSREVSEGSQNKTASNVGPLKWMSPEGEISMKSRWNFRENWHVTAIREREYSNKSDVYSFGITIWEVNENSIDFLGNFNESYENEYAHDTFLVKNNKKLLRIYTETKKDNAQVGTVPWCRRPRHRAQSGFRRSPTGYLSRMRWQHAQAHDMWVSLWHPSNLSYWHVSACWAKDPAERPTFTQVIAWMTGKINYLDQQIDDSAAVMPDLTPQKKNYDDAELSTAVYGPVSVEDLP